MDSNLATSLIPAGAVMFLILGLYKSFLESKVKAQEHIQDLLGQAPQQGAMASVKDAENILKKRKKSKDGLPSRIDQLEEKLERANLLLTPNEFILICLGTAPVGGALCWFLASQSLLFGVGGAIASAFLPYAFVVIKGALRMKKAAAQFADVLDNMVNGFKTGFGFSRAVQMVSTNFDDPWGTEFGKMYAEMNLGATMEDALFSLAKRVPSPDVDLFVTALLIQKDTGGSMAELLGNLSHTIRERYKLYQRVGAISAQGKLSAGAVCCVPFLLCGIMFVMLQEATIAFVTNPIGIVVLILTGFWMCCGIGVLYKMVQIEV